MPATCTRATSPPRRWTPATTPTAGRAQQGYDNHERNLTDEQRAAFRAEGRQPALRLRVPDEDLSFDDLVRGPITFPAGSTTDFVVVRPNGAPLYTFVNPVDDALMGVTHVLRGEDLLSSTPRQVALYTALIAIGVTDFIPLFGHLPYVMGDGNKKLSKRDPESNLFHHRDRGFVPEGLLNYLSLLGWSIAADRDVFSRDELVAAFDVHDVNPNPARFDLKKAESINGDHVRLLTAEDFTARIVPYLSGLVADPPTPAQQAILREAAPLVQERINLLGEARGMLGFLFTPDDEIEYDEDALPVDRDEARLVLDASYAALENLDDFSTEAIEAALRAALIDGAGLKPRVAFGPLRTAISGPAGQPAAVRVDGDPRQGVDARPARTAASAPLVPPEHLRERQSDGEEQRDRDDHDRGDRERAAPQARARLDVHGSGGRHLLRHEFLRVAELVEHGLHVGVRTRRRAACPRGARRSRRAASCAAVPGCRGRPCRSASARR